MRHAHFFASIDYGHSITHVLDYFDRLEELHQLLDDITQATTSTAQWPALILYFLQSLDRLHTLFLC